MLLSQSIIFFNILLSTDQNSCSRSIIRGLGARGAGGQLPPHFLLKVNFYTIKNQFLPPTFKDLGFCPPTFRQLPKGLLHFSENIIKMIMIQKFSPFRKLQHINLKGKLL
jgi:hypothetical protein